MRFTKSPLFVGLVAGLITLLIMLALRFAAERSVPVPSTPAKAVDHWPPDKVLLGLTENDPYSIGNSLEHLGIFGQTGSGKSSSSGRAFLTSMMQAGYGGLVLCVKNSERAFIERIARQTGRLQDLVVLSADSAHRFNPLAYEARRGGPGGGQAENIVQLCRNAQEIVNRQHGGQLDFWAQSSHKLLRFASIVLLAAGEPLSLPAIHDLLFSAPHTTQEVDAEDNIWRDTSLCSRMLQQGDQAAKDAALSRDFEIAARYLLREFPLTPDVTRGGILANVSAICDPFLTGILRTVFMGNTNVVPEMAFNGAIFCLDFPIQEFREMGQVAQVLYKYCFMRAMERRDVSQYPRPVFIWSDEHHYHYTSHDQQFLTTARSARVSVSVITQNLDNFHAVLPGDRGHHETSSLLANLGCKVFHLNTGITNQYASELCGRSRQMFRGTSTSISHAMPPLLSPGGQTNPQPHASASMSEQLDWELPPESFLYLRCGGERHQLTCDAVVVQPGRKFSTTGRCWTFTSFRQT
jgi:hypothetical protein